jgi:hypothetical protein
MDLLGMAGSGVLTTDVLVGLVYSIIKLVAFGAVGVVVLGALVACLCDLFEGREWRRCRGRTEVWRLMH